MKLFTLFKKEFASEVRKWTDEKIISKDQAQSILERYGISPGVQMTSAGYYVLLTIAAAFAGLAVILLLSHNWNEIPRAVRMGLMFLLTAGFHAAGIYYFSKKNTKASNIWFFLAGIMFGASIFLIAQIYHLGEHFPDGFYYWALGLLPFFLITGSGAIGILFTLISFTWMLTESSMHFYPLSYPLFLAVTYWHVYRHKSLTLFILNTLALLYFAQVTVSYFIDPYLDDIYVENMYFSFGLFALFVVIGNVLKDMQNEKLRIYGRVLADYSFRIFIITLFFYSFREVCNEFFEEKVHYGFLAWWLTVVLFLTGIFVTVHKIRLKKSIKELWQSHIFSATILVFTVAMYLFAFSFDEGDREKLDLAFAIFVNVVLILTGIGMIIQGVHIPSAVTYYFGVFTLLITALLRYFNLIEDYITGAFIFFVAAGIMYLAARWWQKRAKEVNHEA